MWPVFWGSKMIPERPSNSPFLKHGLCQKAPGPANWYRTGLGSKGAKARGLLDPVEGEDFGLQLSHIWKKHIQMSGECLALRSEWKVREKQWHFLPRLFPKELQITEPEGFFSILLALIWLQSLPSVGCLRPQNMGNWLLPVGWGQGVSKDTFFFFFTYSFCSHQSFS